MKLNRYVIEFCSHFLPILGRDIRDDLIDIREILNVFDLYENNLN